MRIAATIQYNGRAYSGMQLQKESLTIQGEIEQALKTITRRSVRIHCAGRTDAGVHAYGQVIHFDLPQAETFEIDRLIYGINSIIGGDISIIHGQIVPDDFHARFSCLGREYIFKVVNTPFPMALYKHTAAWIRYPLDIKKMEEAAMHLLGEHDFAAFTRTVYKKNEEKTIRRIDEIQILKRGFEILFYFRGSGFLHNMIRIIMGTLLRVGRNFIAPEQIKDILDNKERVKAGVTMSSKGLYFYRALYSDYVTPAELLPLLPEKISETVL